MASLIAGDDPGQDGHTSGANTNYGRDAFAMLLGYHERDFVKSGSVLDSTTAGTSSWHMPGPTFLYNGNISSWVWHSRAAAGTSNGALASVYRYDVVNRLKTDSLRTRGVSAWNAVGSTFHSSYTYDGNGNLTALYRQNELTNQMDALTYSYDAGTNRLNHIDDAQGASGGGDLGDQAANNYVYDATGNLTQDIAEGINGGGIVWTPYGKVRSITQAGDSPTNKVEYLYDAQGNRVLKRSYNNTSSTLRTTTWYVRDGRGNVVGIYVKPSGSDANLTEAPVYGTSRIGTAYNLGQYSTSTGQTKALFGTVHSRPLGEKVYELTDHLGNVRATTSDVTILHSGSRDAELRTWTDYYPFGMEMPSRAWRAGTSPRYGYNGKENDDEVKGEGNQQDYGFRIYDPRVARFLSVDPLTADYPANSPYGYASNSPIKLHDFEGGVGLPDDLINYAKRAGIAFLKKTAADVVKASTQTIVSAAKYKVEKYLDENVNSNGPLRTSLALTTEFMTGLGPEERTFGPDHPFTVSLKESNMTTEAIKAFSMGYQEYLAGKRKDVPLNYRVDFSYLFGGDTGPFKELIKDGKFTAAQFLGTADYHFSLSSDRKTLRIHVEDTKTEYSLLYHAPGTDRHTRDENKIMGETRQLYNFSVTMEEVRRRAGAKNDK